MLKLNSIYRNKIKTNPIAPVDMDEVVLTNHTVLDTILLDTIPGFV